MPGELLQRHLEPVRDRVRRVVGDDVAGLEAAVGVVGLLGLGGIDRGPARDIREREAGARDHAAAADRRDHGIESLDLLGELQRAGRLSRDHPGIVVGVDEVRPRLLLDLGEGRLPARGRRFALGDHAAIAAHGVLLRLRRGPRHHHIAGNAPPSRRVGERERVVARGMGGHAPLRRLLVEPEDRVRGAAHLEGGGLLEVLALEEQLRPRHRVDEGRGQHRRAVDMRPDALVRDLHVIEAGNVHGTVFGACL